jgi:fucose 4-O-acetylase-like acetyltransferase
MTSSLAPPSSPSPSRLFYVDNLRIYLIVLVVLHHVSVGYGGPGGWPLKETPTDPISPILLLLFNGVNQSYFMSFFFLLSGYFLVGSCDRKGPWKCLVDRLVRLGIPLLAYVLIIAPLVAFIVVRLAQGREASLVDVYAYFWQHRRISVGPLWFVEALLIFSIVYLAIRSATERIGAWSHPTLYAHCFPANKAIAGCMVLLTLGTFIMRLYFPVGAHLVHFQPGHFFHYVVCFWLGILAFRGNWLAHLPAAHGRLWGRVALITLILLPVAIAISLWMGDGPDVFMGGISWQAFIAAAWESVACLSIIVFLLYVFQTRLNRQGPYLKTLSANAYTVFIVHQFVITLIMALLYQLAWPSALKFILVALIGPPTCFIFSHYVVRQIPWSARVLG